MKTPIKRWLSWRRLLVLAAEVVAVGSHLIHHNVWVTGTIILLSLASIVWKAVRDQQEFHWSHHGGYEIMKSMSMFTFCDATGHLVVGRKTQILKAYQHNITSIDDGNIGCTGTIGRITVSGQGNIGTPELDGVHHRYTTQLGHELPFRKPFERWVEVEYIDSYTASAETAVVNALYGTKRLEVFLRFHRDRCPKRIELRDRGHRGNEILDSELVDVHGDGTEYSFGVDHPEQGSKYVFKIHW